MSDDDEPFSDTPATHLDDEAYEAFLATEFDRDGVLRGEPRVRWVIGFAIVLLAAVAVILFL